MMTANTEMKKDSPGLEMEIRNSDHAYIRSSWTVTLPRGNTSIGTKLLSEALQAGLETKRDRRRTSFFEAETGDAWFYFHIAEQLGRIYLVAAFVR
jgi:hypothetical protein